MIDPAQLVASNPLLNGTPQAPPTTTLNGGRALGILGDTQGFMGRPPIGFMQSAMPSPIGGMTSKGPSNFGNFISQVMQSLRDVAGAANKTPASDVMGAVTHNEIGAGQNSGVQSADVQPVDMASLTQGIQSLNLQHAHIDTGTNVSSGIAQSGGQGYELG